jgi:hypothetical protein
MPASIFCDELSGKSRARFAKVIHKLEDAEWMIFFKDFAKPQGTQSVGLKANRIQKL